MFKYYVDYISKGDGDVCHVWVMAYGKQDAEDQVRMEYWDVKEIIDVRKA